MNAEIIEFRPRRLRQLQRRYDETGNVSDYLDVIVCRDLQGHHDSWLGDPEHEQHDDAQQQLAL
jgi:hypothetical protein